MIRERAAELSKASCYRFGDPMCFEVPIAEGITLPGRHNPAVYTRERPASVLVFCPGNGGLATHLALGGAQVHVVEPRPRFTPALTKVLELFRDANPGKEIQLHERPEGITVDLVIWPEGHDELPAPVDDLRALLGLLNPGGKLIIEVSFGQRQGTEGKLHTWRPTNDAWAAALGKLGATQTQSVAGRRGTQRIVTVEPPVHARRAEPAKPPAPAQVVAAEDPPAPAFDADAPRHVHVDHVKAETPLEAPPVSDVPVVPPVPEVEQFASAPPPRPSTEVPPEELRELPAADEAPPPTESQTRDDFVAAPPRKSDRRGRRGS